MPSSVEVVSNYYDDRLMTDSGYNSDSADSPQEIVFTSAHLKFLNKQLSALEPEDILRWCLLSLPGLYQTTALGLTGIIPYLKRLIPGLVITDILSKISPDRHRVPLIFIDTLHHFPETLALLDTVKQRYPTAIFHVYTPEGTPNVSSFTAKHGSELWNTNESLYDFLVKVEPARRAYKHLSVRAILTGRRKSQGGARGTLDIIEIDETGLIKINPLANWSFQQVESYIRRNHVPYNKLLDQGYRSVGDWHSTAPVKEGEDERAGRWKGKNKTECGLHENYIALKIKAKQEAEAKAKEDENEAEGTTPL
jgi:phosphoadenosine phosphosulfate reductase